MNIGKAMVMNVGNVVGWVSAARAAGHQGRFGHACPDNWDITPGEHLLLGTIATTSKGEWLSKNQILLPISHLIGLNLPPPLNPSLKQPQKCLVSWRRRNLSRPVGLPLPVGLAVRQSGKRQCELTMVALWPYIVPHCPHCGSVGETIKGTCASRPIHLNSRERGGDGRWVFISSSLLHHQHLHRWHHVQLFIVIGILLIWSAFLIKIRRDYIFRDVLDQKWFKFIWPSNWRQYFQWHIYKIDKLDATDQIQK